MSPPRQVGGEAGVARRGSGKGRGPSQALRQALARRRLEEYREAKLLEQHLHDVFTDGHG
ncbi:MAG TPA: hypothetical protein VKA14_09975 [Gammaproteobacteria bacterium]|nr:hypothetical protein [Gammaproteobacteria bacterium]